MKHNKLVRDNIPKIILQNGDLAKTHIADDKEYKQKLRKKLVEEVNEFLSNTNEKELADVKEVLTAIAKLYQLDQSKIQQIQKSKALKRGKFNKRIILDETNKNT